MISTIDISLNHAHRKRHKKAVHEEKEQQNPRSRPRLQERKSKPAVDEAQEGSALMKEIEQASQRWNVTMEGQHNSGNREGQHQWNRVQRNENVQQEDFEERSAHNNGAIAMDTVPVPPGSEVVHTLDLGGLLETPSTSDQSNFVGQESEQQNNQELRFNHSNELDWLDELEV